MNYIDGKPLSKLAISTIWDGIYMLYYRGLLNLEVIIKLSLGQPASICIQFTEIASPSDCVQGLNLNTLPQQFGQTR